MSDPETKVMDPWPVVLKADPQKGRHLVASKELAAGEKVLSHRAFAAVVNDAYREVACSYCLKVCTVQILRCGGCNLTHFCGEACLDASRQIHSCECNALQGLAKLGVEGESQAMRLAIRIAVMKGLKEPQNDFDKSIEFALSLEDHWDDASKKIKQGLLTVGRALGALVSGWTAEALSRLLLLLQCNAHVIKDKTAITGLGLFPLASMLNHSCEPNAHHYFRLKAACLPTLTFRALSPIPPQQEVCYSYADLLQPVCERVALLSCAYFFTCTCPRCTPTTPTTHTDSLPHDTSTSAPTPLEQEEGGTQRGPAVVDAMLAGLTCVRVAELGVSCVGVMLASTTEAGGFQCSHCSAVEGAREHEERREVAMLGLQSRMAALQGVSPLSGGDLLCDEVVALADLLLGPSRCALHPCHWMVYQALLLLATTAQDMSKSTPSPSESRVAKTVAWLEAASCVRLVSTLRACLPPLPFPDLASRLLAASAALERLQQAAIDPTTFITNTAYEWEWPRQADGRPLVLEWAELRDEASAIRALAFGSDEDAGV